jgi:hypothetical protein
LVGRNTVASPQVVNGSLQSKDLSARARAALKGNRGAKGDKGDKGNAGSPGAPGTAVAYALVTGAGAVDPSTAKNIATANVTHLPPGGYCISGLGFTPKNVVATLESPPANADLNVAVALGKGPSSCPAGTQIRVFIKTGANVFLDSNFFISVN